MTRAYSPIRLITVLFIAVLFSQCFSPIITAESHVINQYRAEIIQTISHDEDAFTQGLLFHNGSLYESTGLYNESTVREVSLETGEVLRSITLNNSEFGEGLAIHNGSLIQLTWKSGVAHIYDVDNFTETGTFYYNGEGWGICSNDSNFVMSNGSSNLTIRDHGDFSIIDTVSVNYNGSPLDQINELECVGDYIFANVWHWESIFIINLTSGDVVGVIDAGALFPEPHSGGVLNGIAYDSVSETFWLTGKRWPIMHQVTWIPVISSGGDSEPNSNESEGLNITAEGSEMVESTMVILISFLFSLATFKLWGNGFASVTRSREIDNPPTATAYREGLE